MSLIDVVRHAPPIDLWTDTPPTTLEMAPANTNHILEKLDGLRNELVDLAFTLECRGRLDAADVAITTSARVGEICEDLVTAGLA